MKKEYKGIEILSRETLEEKVIRLENELLREKQGRNNDIQFAENEYKALAKRYLELCDDDFCNGDCFVGEKPCHYWNEDCSYCQLKMIAGIC